MVYFKKWSRWTLVIIILLASSIFLIESETNSSISSVNAQTLAYEPRFELTACPEHLTISVPFTCGYLIVPEDRNNPDGNQVHLAVAIVKSRSEDAAPDPILFVQGDLGMDAIGTGLPYVETHYREWILNRDFIILNQRGANFSEPSLNCPEMELMYFERIGLHLPPEEDTRLANAAIQRCYERHGVDARFYNTEQSALDIRDLRIALEIDEWNLFAFSGATRTVLSVVRDYPEGIRSIILDAVMPTDVVPYIEELSPLENGINKLIDACNADPACAEDYPDLLETLLLVIAKYNANPVVIPVWHPLEADVTEFYLDGNIAITKLTKFIGSTGNTGRIPLMADQLLNEEYDDFAALLSKSLLVEMFFAEGAFMSTYCHASSNIPADAEPTLVVERELPEELTAAILAGQQSSMTNDICEIWITDGASENYYAPVESDIPALLMTGSFDVASPPEWGIRTLDGLPNGIFIEVPGLGHGVLKTECPIEIATQFLADPTSELDTGCLANMPAFDYVARSE